MQFTIILEGSETPVQLAKARAAVNAYCDASGKSTTMELELRVDSTAAMAELERFKAAVGGLDIPESVGEKLEVELLNKLEAENPQFCGLQIVENPAIPAGEVALVSPQFGQQPLPPGAEPADDAESLGVPGAPLLPLAPSSAPSPAGAKTSASAPAAAPASIPPPPSAASAVPSPPPAAATPAPAAAVDAKGLPWDERIHASSRAKIADGSWRMKRGVQSHVVEAVEAELRGQSHGSAALDADALKLAAMGADPGPSLPAAPAPLPPGPPALTFGIVASRIGKAVTAGTLSGNVLSVKLAELGFPDGLHTVNARPDMWQKILDTLGA